MYVIAIASMLVEVMFLIRPISIPTPTYLTIHTYTVVRGFTLVTGTLRGFLGRSADPTSYSLARQRISRFLGVNNVTMRFDFLSDSLQGRL